MLLSDLPEVRLALQMLATKHGAGRIDSDVALAREWYVRLRYLNSMLKRLRLRGGFARWREVICDAQALTPEEMELIGMRRRLDAWRRVEVLWGDVVQAFIDQQPKQPNGN